MTNLVALLSGLIFGLGLILAEMANPAKVLAFLDVAGRWDPSLALVMGGAAGVASLAFAHRYIQGVVAGRQSTLPQAGDIQPGRNEGRS